MPRVSPAPPPEEERTWTGIWRGRVPVREWEVVWAAWVVAVAAAWVVAVEVAWVVAAVVAWVVEEQAWGGGAL